MPGMFFMRNRIMEADAAA